jgi:putative nucleotidyltransferase with HDIG domain
LSDARTALTRLLQQLAGALRAAALYPPGHPAVHTPLRELATGLALLLREREKVALGLLDDVLVLDEMPFYDAPDRFRALCSALEAGELESVTFLPGVGLGELEALLQVLAPRDAAERERPALERAKRFELPHVRLRDRVEGADRRAVAQRTYERTLGIVVDLASEIRLGRIPTAGHATQVVTTMRDLVLADESALLGLALLKSYDDYTYAHSVNVAIFSLAFARHLGIEGPGLERVGVAGLLHDLGKVRTAESIIKKPGALTSDEMEVMQRHPELGAEILAAMKGIDGETAEIVLHHHLRHDGSGYPRLPAGREPHPHGVIVALADCYDALTTTRSYQRARHPSEAVRILRRLGGHAYAPGRTQAFIDMIGAYPVGELVRLSTNELAVVSRVSDLDATAPWVKLVSDARGVPLPQPLDCDLSAEPVGGRVIAGVVDPLRKGVDVVRVLGL